MNNKTEEKNRLEQELKWVKCRIEILDKIEMKLNEMKSLAEYVKNNVIYQEEIEDINRKIKKLEREVIMLENESKKCWIDNN